MKLAVVFGGPSPEHDVSILTGLLTLRELSKTSRHEVSGIYWTRTGDFVTCPANLEAADFSQGSAKIKDGTDLRLVAQPGGGFLQKGALGRDKSLDIDVLLNCCHGGPGEDGSLQGVLDLAQVKHAGPSMAGAALGMDKLSFGALVGLLGAPSLPRELVDDRTQVGFPGPYIVKPRFGGSSIGIETVEDLDSARALAKSSVHLRRGAVVEPYRPDLFDLNIAIRCWPQVELSSIEKPLRRSEGAEILNYLDKYVGGQGMITAPREIPANISPELKDQIEHWARTLCGPAMIRGIARLDFLSNGDELFVNELNTIPGSMGKHLWVEPDLEFGRLLDDMIDEAQNRPSTIFSTAGADGTVLVSAGDIASKLS